MKFGRVIGLAVALALVVGSAGAEMSRVEKLAWRDAKAEAKRYYSAPAGTLWPAQFKAAPTCSGAADCAAKWEAAQLWVSRHAGYGVKVVTTVLISTEGIGELSDDTLAVRVTNQPDARGLHHIVIEFFCQIDERIMEKRGCPDPVLLTNEFNAAIKGTV